MVIYHNLNLVPQPFRNPVITIGNFDGVHLGHQTLFQKVTNRSRAVDGQSVVITFDPHPIKLMRPDKRLPMLTTTDQKIKLLASMELDGIIVHPFSAEFGSLPAREFVQYHPGPAPGTGRWLLDTTTASAADREGNIALLQSLGTLEFGFPVHVVDPIQINHTIVSSTLIRNLINEGQVLSGPGFFGAALRSDR